MEPSSSSSSSQPLLSRKRPGGDTPQVCFSKRRKGLLKKVAELCILTGAKAAAVAFSPGDEAYSLGYPDVDSVLDHLAGPPSSSSSSPESTAEREILEAVLLEMLEKGPWWDPPIEDMGVDELRRMYHNLEELKRSMVELLRCRSAVELLRCRSAAVQGEGEAISCC